MENIIMTYLPNSMKRYVQYSKYYKPILGIYKKACKEKEARFCKKITAKNQYFSFSNWKI